MTGKLAKKKQEAEINETKEKEVLENNDSTEVNDLKEQLEKKQAETDALNDKYLRIVAEYDNFKRRTQKEKEQLYKDSACDIISQILPVIDNLERALSAFGDKDNDYYKGVEMVMRQTEEIFSKMGVEAIESVGKEFNPELHNAVMHIDDENYGDSIIAEEFQKGYKYKDKVIRYSMVKVAN